MASRINSVDLNLFFVLDALYRHRSVSKAAQELGLTQSAISHSLAKIRTHFADPMFVRVAGGIKPTKTAMLLESEIVLMIEKARQLTAQAKEFRLDQINDTLVIYCTDLFETLYGPAIFKKIKSEAPRINLAFKAASGAFPKEVLERGECDVAIGGFLKSLPNGFYKQSLIKDEYVVSLRRNHPTLKQQLTEKIYFDQTHARMTMTGDLSDQLKKLGARKLPRNIQYGSSQFASLFQLISQTDLILTAPRKISKFYQNLLNTEIRKCPIKIPPLQVEMGWHGLTHTDPLRKWLREVIREICMER